MAVTHEPHAGSTRLYWMIGGILAIVTLIEVGVVYLPIHDIFIILLLLVLSATKGSLVVMFFMHLKGDARVFKFLFLAPFFIAVSMLLIFLVLFSGHSGIAG